MRVCFRRVEVWVAPSLSPREVCTPSLAAERKCRATPPTPAGPNRVFLALQELGSRRQPGPENLSWLELRGVRSRVCRRQTRDALARHLLRSRAGQGAPSPYFQACWAPVPSRHACSFLWAKFRCAGRAARLVHQSKWLSWPMRSPLDITFWFKKETFYSDV